MKIKSWRLIRHTLMGDLIHHLKLNAVRRKWIKKHTDSDSFPMNIFPEECVEIGKGSYGELNVVTFSDKSKLKIGNYVSIAQNVYFLLDVEHHSDHLSTYPFRTKIMNQLPESFAKGDIVVADDVWIGFGAMIMSGVTIGQGAVVAASTVVTKDVEPYSIVGGVPARIIKYRFTKDVRDYLLTLDYSSLTKELISQNKDDLYTAINDMTLDEVERFFSWFTKKDLSTRGK